MSQTVDAAQRKERWTDFIGRKAGERRRRLAGGGEGGEGEGEGGDVNGPSVFGGPGGLPGDAASRGIS